MYTFRVTNYWETAKYIVYTLFTKIMNDHSEETVIVSYYSETRDQHQLW